jgi:glucose/arabinose dehydrogenase
VYNARALLLAETVYLNVNYPKLFASLLLCVCAKPPVYGIALSLFLISACGPQPTQQVFQATLPATQNSAPIYTATPTFTPSATFTATPTLTFTPTETLTPSPTLSRTPVPSPTPTQSLFTLTHVSAEDAPPAIENRPAELSASTGWSCDDFPCEDDLDGFMQRIQVPPGYVLEHVGQLPGQPMQITYGPDGRLYATVLEDGTRSGAVYALDENGQSQRYSSDFVSPVGLAFQPGTDVLYVTARVTLEEGGGLWRIPPGGGEAEPVITDLPCCYGVIDNQPNGIVFGPDGYLHMGIGALTDHAESQNPESEPYAEIQPHEAAILRIQPHTGEIEVFAQGLHNPYDLTFDATGVMFATDSGIAAGPGDRLLAIRQGAHYGWPYYRTRGCEECPSMPALAVEDDLFPFADFTLPRGIVAYTGTQFPANMFNSLFVVLWNGTPDGQRVVRLNPHDLPRATADWLSPAAEPFITGLIRPIDVTIAPDGSLVVADFIYGHVWRVYYVGE